MLLKLFWKNIGKKGRIAHFLWDTLYLGVQQSGTSVMSYKLIALFGWTRV